MRIVLTGFNPFADLEVNPSQEVVERLAAAAPPAGVTLRTEVLPTEYARAGERVRALIAETRPAALLALGVARERTAINLERFALNLNDSQPDNAGDAPQGRLIAADGPAAYRATLPLEAMHGALNAEGFPVQMSNHAGTYLCNHVFYLARHELERQGSTAPCGFIHLPGASAPGAVAPMPLEAVTAAVARCLAVLAAALGRG